MATTLRFTRCYNDNELDNSGVKFTISNEMGQIEFGDFCKVDMYVIAELVAEYNVTLISLSFFQMNIALDDEFYNACKAAAKSAGIEFVCTAG